MFGGGTCVAVVSFYESRSSLESSGKLKEGAVSFVLWICLHIHSEGKCCSTSIFERAD